MQFLGIDYRKNWRTITSGYMSEGKIKRREMVYLRTEEMQLLLLRRLVRLERKCSVAPIRGDWTVERSRDGCRGRSGYVGSVSWWKLEGGGVVRS